MTLDAALVTFLAGARNQTYAAGNRDADVDQLLTGSRQLEHRDGDRLYRDIYFGNASFVGQETIYEGLVPVWAMAYAGSVLPDSPVPATEVYRVLRAALQRTPGDCPHRGPSHWSDGLMSYVDDGQGDMNWFWGTETIAIGERVVYRLRYSGGLLR